MAVSVEESATRYPLTGNRLMITVQAQPAYEHPTGLTSYSMVPAPPWPEIVTW